MVWLLLSQVILTLKILAWLEAKMSHLVSLLLDGSESRPLIFMGFNDAEGRWSEQLMYFSNDLAL